MDLNSFLEKLDFPSKIFITEISAADFYCFCHLLKSMFYDCLLHTLPRCASLKLNLNFLRNFFLTSLKFFVFHNDSISCSIRL